MSGADAPYRCRGRDELKSAEEIMEILDAYDLTGSFRDAGELAGCSHHTVKHYVDRRAAGGELDQTAARLRLIDEYLPKVEEWVERSFGKVRADVAHEKLVALGYKGSERTTRRAVARVKQSYRSGRVRVHRPGSPSRGCGCSTTTATARSSTASRRCCSWRGWRGRGSGS
jgi:hypothetical protein